MHHSGRYLVKDAQNLNFGQPLVEQAVPIVSKYIGISLLPLLLRHINEDDVLAFGTQEMKFLPVEAV